MLVLGVLCGLGSVARATDYFSQWDAKGFLQPQLRVDEQKKTYIEWRRIRAYLSGPVTKDLRCAFTFDRASEHLEMLDCYLDYTPLKGNVQANVKGGIFFPTWSKEGMSLPVNADEALISDSNHYKLLLRQAGMMGSLTFDKRYMLTAGVFNGVMSFSTHNDHAFYNASFTAVEPHFTARAWTEVGDDRNAKTNAQSNATVYGAEVTDIRVGRFLSNAIYVGGRRFGKHMYGGMGELGYRLDKRHLIWGKFDWVNNTAAYNAPEQRAVLSLQRQLNKWILCKVDTEYYQHERDWRGVMNWDVWF
jgi:hypothetical protein